MKSERDFICLCRKKKNKKKKTQRRTKVQTLANFSREMMRGGSTMFAKYCRKGRQYSSSSSNNNNNNRVREVKTLKEVSEGLDAMMARRIPDAIESLAFKTGIFYFGYAAATYNSPYNPEKYDSEMEDLSAKRQELEKKKKKEGSGLEKVVDN